MAQIILTDEQKVSLTVSFKTAAGNPAVVDGVPVWASSDTAIISLEVAADGMSAVATTVGPLGTAQVSVTADADLDPGEAEIREVTATIDIDVRPAEATTVGIAAGTPEPK